MSSPDANIRHPSNQGIRPSIHEIARQRIEKLKQIEQKVKDLNFIEQRTRSDGSASSSTKRNVMTLDEFLMGHPLQIIDGVLRF
jgi:hypothetical protein